MEFVVDHWERVRGSEGMRRVEEMLEGEGGGTAATALRLALRLMTQG